jgi:hypothetical protein
VEERYHPASRESVGDLMSGVRLHGFSVCGVVDPIAAARLCQL